MRDNNNEKFRQDFLVADAHCDTLTALAVQGRRLGDCSNLGHLDLPRLRTGGINLQFFAAFIAPEYKGRSLRRALELIELFHREMEENSSEIMLVRNQAETNLALNSGKIAALLTVEGGEALEGSLEVLRVLHRLGVRSLTLTWNGANELGEGAGIKDGKGLTAFGLRVVEEMNHLGLLVDVSHLSERGFWDGLGVASQPVIASHSNCRTLCDHPRNLSDRQIAALAERGGVMGITFVPSFLSKEKSTINDILRHIDHAVKVGGEDCVALGSDFDGTEELPEGLAGCSGLPLLTEGLLNMGYSPDRVKKILGGNILRLIGQVLK